MSGSNIIEKELSENAREDNVPQKKTDLSDKNVIKNAEVELLTLKEKNSNDSDKSSIDIEKFTSNKMHSKDNFWNEQHKKKSASKSNVIADDKPNASMPNKGSVLVNDLKSSMA
jgi:hypothetical protein